MEEYVGRRAVLCLQMGQPSGEAWLHVGQRVAASQDWDARGFTKALRHPCDFGGQ